MFYCFGTSKNRSSNMKTQKIPQIVAKIPYHKHSQIQEKSQFWNPSWESWQATKTNHLQTRHVYLSTVTIWPTILVVIRISQFFLTKFVSLTFHFTSICGHAKITVAENECWLISNRSKTLEKECRKIHEQAYLEICRDLGSFDVFAFGLAHEP